MAFPLPLLLQGAPTLPPSTRVPHSHPRARDREQDFGTDHGGSKALEKLDLDLAVMEPRAQTRVLRKHGKGHAAQMLRRKPLLPCHYFVFDIMHGMHNEANVLLDESVHQHLMVAKTSKDEQVIQTITTAQTKINALWKEQHLPKFIQFGHDEDGVHSHAMNGPTAEAVMDRPSLIIETIQLMAPVYELLETRKQVPPLQAEVVGEGAISGPKPDQKKEQAKAKGKVKEPAKKSRKVDWGAREKATKAGGEKAPDIEKQGKEPTHTDGTRTSTTDRPGDASSQQENPPAASRLKYSQRVGAAWVAYIELYDYLKSGHGVPASELTPDIRMQRGDTAIELALNLQRAMLGLIGTHRRRTYAHDLVYGMHQLYMLFGKPWNAATEGNEHAHQDMKKFFHGMACHNPSMPHSDCYQVLRMTVVKAELLRSKAHLLPASNYAAMRANRVLAETAARVDGKRRGLAGPKGLKCHVDKETKRAAGSKRIMAEVVGQAAWKHVVGTDTD